MEGQKARGLEKIEQILNWTNKKHGNNPDHHKQTKTQPNQNMKELQWKLFGPWSNDLIDDQNYAVVWKDSSGHFCCPHLAYWVEDERRFFSLQHNDSFPIQVDMYIELPELPN